LGAPRWKLKGRGGEGGGRYAHHVGRSFMRYFDVERKKRTHYQSPSRPVDGSKRAKERDGKSNASDVARAQND